MLSRLTEALDSMGGISVAVAEPPDEDYEGWRVVINPDREEDGRPTPEAWHFLTMLAYGVHSWISGVRLTIEALPPMFNEQPHIWALEGTADPDEFARAVEQLTILHLDPALDEWEEE